MSMETHVFFRGTLPSKAALSRAMKELGFPFSITPATGSLEAQAGFMPMKLRGEETGVELSIYGDHSAVEEFADAGVDPGFERRASLRWGGDFQEAVAGMCVAATLAKLVDGVVFDEAEDRLLSVDDAIAVARQNLQTLLKPEDKKRRGTRPADLKHYLKPLLKQRSDLVLLGRLLIIRPVRHLLRGAFFDRTSYKYQFRVLRCVKPLFSVEESFHFGFCTDVHPLAWTVWEPHFAALLFDMLDEDVFQPVGKITSLAQFGGDLGIGDLGRNDQFELRVAALVLAGQRQRAAELIEMELAQTARNGYERRHYVAGEQRALLERNLESMCAEFHSKERQAAEILKLGDAWEPAPFPGELPEIERARRCDDPPFLTTPWISRPPRLVEQPPEKVGDVHFASGVLGRKDGVVMFGALTHEEAEEKHRTRQAYALATRLPDGYLLVVRHDTRWSPHDPDQPRNPDYVPTRTFRLEVHGARGRLLYTEFGEDFDNRGMLKMWNIDVHEPVPYRTIWDAHNYTKERIKNIVDHRSDPSGYMNRPMTDSDVALCKFAEPRFGDFNDLWRRVETYLQNEGFGTLRDNFEC
ncbi:MAG: hypothetical protein ACM3OF_01745 [Gemmatimonas sp.]